MTLAWIGQLLFNLLALALIGFAIMQVKKKRTEDAKLSKGLQLLQSKISVLEDLSDRVEHQVNNSMVLIETKQIELNKKVSLVDSKLAEINQSMQKSMEVAKIFEDKIPHSEIIERKNTIQYVKAAMMAYEGASVEHIASLIDLPRGEIEMLAKVNRNELSFSQDRLPDWVKSEITNDGPRQAQPIVSKKMSPPVSDATEEDMISTYFAPAIIHSDDDQDWQVTGPDFELPQLEPALSAEDNLKRLGEKFRQAALSFEKRSPTQIVTTAESSQPVSQPVPLSTNRQATHSAPLSTNRQVSQPVPLSTNRQGNRQMNSQVNSQSNQDSNHQSNQQVNNHFIQQPVATQKMKYPPVDESLQPSVFHKVSRSSTNQPVRVRKLEFPKVG